MNPWHKRANEFIRNASELLPLVSPRPIKQFFDRDHERFFDRLVVVVGAPGSGKTTLARLLEFSTLVAIRDFAGDSEVKELITSLAHADVLRDLNPALLALRMPTGGQLRAIWDLPYNELLRHRLLQNMIQAKAALGWLRQLEQEGVNLGSVQIYTVQDSEAGRAALRADNVLGFRQKAREVEREIFQLVSALVAPPETELSERLATIAFEPFSNIEMFEVEWRGQRCKLRPMIILDDAHELHPIQLKEVDRWLRTRDFKVARWILMRADLLGLDDYRQVLREDDRHVPGTQPGRDRVRVFLQEMDRPERRPFFRTVAEDVARRYVVPLPTLGRHGGTRLKALLDTVDNPTITEAEQRELDAEVRKLMSDQDISPKDLAAIESGYPKELNRDVRSALSRILLHRESRRTPQRSLFGGHASDEPASDPSRPKPALVRGAELHLLHRFGRPYYYGFEKLADAANENIEQFVTLASVLIDQLETQAIRKKPLTLTARQQHKAVQDHASVLIRQWDFPYAPKVRRLAEFIAGRCRDLTLRPNAPLDDGANAYGVERGELAGLEANDELALVLRYAFAYQALVLTDTYECKGKTWSLFELGGLSVISNGLTLSRGGFAEGALAELRTVVREVS